MADISILLAQLNLTVGAIQANSQKIIAAIKQARTEFNADIIAFPELALSGYPPEDLLLREDFLDNIQRILFSIQRQMPANIIAIIGYPEKENHKLYNSAIVINCEKIIANYRKQALPNYGVFDEKRYFTAGDKPCVFHYKNKAIGLVICEDLWAPNVGQQTRKAGAELFISLNASPFDENKIEQRLTTMHRQAQTLSVPLFYVNHCCGQDDLIFDGSSFILDAKGEITAQAPFAQEILLTSAIQHPLPSRDAQCYQALVLGLRDYVHKNHFEKVLVGFSGGIDSALTLTIAVDAIGKDNVMPIILPSRYTSSLSLNAAKMQLNLMELKEQTLSIEPAFTAFLNSLAIDTTQPPSNLTTQNLQARCRGMLLMALSNQTNALLLNTTNKSELAMGFGTLYGDMCGGYAVLKDVWKSDVYRLAHYRNQIENCIPEQIITRPPSAELAPNQLDTDTLPPYDILDDILIRYIEKNQTILQIIAAGFDGKIVHFIIKTLLQSEYKRRQAPPGPRITRCAFGRERRYPITLGK